VQRRPAASGAAAVAAALNEKQTEVHAAVAANIF